MKKTKLFTSIAALALVLGLGACDTTSEEEVTPSESEGTTQSSETTGETTGGEEESKTTPAPEVGEYFLGFDVDGTVNYIDGGTASGYDYEGTLTTNIGYAVPVTLAAADGDDAYYLTFELDEATYYVCIIDTGSHVNLQYLTTATPIYWDETHAAWVNEKDTYFLCYNSTFKCAYASAFADWWGSSPVGELFDIPEGWEPEEPEELPSSEVTYVGEVTEGTYKFGAFDTTSWSYLYISTGVSTASNHYLIPTSDWTYGANISITSYEDGYTLSYELGEQTRYITYTGSSTAVTTSTEPYVWYYDSENAVFTSATENGRFLGLATNADAFRAYSYTNDGLTTYAHAIPYTTQPVPEEKPNEGDDDEKGSAYKLGALDSTNYCYRYFSGSTTGSTFLATTTDWDQAANVYITAVDDEIENSCTLSFIDANGSTKYISNNNSTSVTLADDPCVWVWVDSLEIFAQGSSSGRALVLYTDGSLRGYAQTDQNLAYPHVHAYTEAQENPEAPEVTTSYEQVSSLGNGGEFYAGGYSSSTLYLTTGKLSGYNLACTKDLDSAVPFTVTGNASDGYTLTCSDGKYVYAYDTGSYYDFGTSDAATVPSSGTKVFYWNDDASTLYCNGSDVRTTARYTYVYFEFYGGNVVAYGTNSLNASTSNLAHFYQQVTA